MDSRRTATSPTGPAATPARAAPAPFGPEPGSDGERPDARPLPVGRVNGRRAGAGRVEGTRTNPKREEADERREAPYRGVARRFLLVHRHMAGLLAGALVARAAVLAPEARRRPGGLTLRAVAGVLRPFLRADLRREPFPVQFRRRLELLGTTYIKLGQILAIREDLLPPDVCRELAHLFDDLPPIPFPRVRRLLAVRLGRPPDTLFEHIDPEPLGSASIAQVHRARTVAGDDVVIKVMKPGIPAAVRADLRLLQLLGWLLQRILPRFQPQRIVAEFSAYTLKELDFTTEADNAETFAANFRDMPEVTFPAIHRDLSCDSVLTMEYLDGFKPHSPAAAALPSRERHRLIGLGAAAIIRMLYRDGFFHADLHPANLLILPASGPVAPAPAADGTRGEPGDRAHRIGFIDLGMVGRFETRTRRRMLYYYHALVTGDTDGAATFLADMAEVGPGGDAAAFHRAVVDLSRRFLARSERGEISIARLILESMGLGARHRVYFPVEMTLMVKALVTFEGVGRALDPMLDVPALSRAHVGRVLKGEFTTTAVVRELLRQAPELLELGVRIPRLLADGGRFLDHAFHQRPPENPAAGLRTAVLSGAALIGAAVALTGGAPPVLWIGLFLLAGVLALTGR